MRINAQERWQLFKPPYDISQIFTQEDRPPSIPKPKTPLCASVGVGACPMSHWGKEAPPRSSLVNSGHLGRGLPYPSGDTFCGAVT